MHQLPARLRRAKEGTFHQVPRGLQLSRVLKSFPGLGAVPWGGWGVGSAGPGQLMRQPLMFASVCLGETNADNAEEETDVHSWCVDEGCLSWYSSNKQ